MLNVVVDLANVALVEALAVGAVVGGEAGVDRLPHIFETPDGDVTHIREGHLVVLNMPGGMVGVTRMSHGVRRCEVDAKLLAAGAAGRAQG